MLFCGNSVIIILYLLLLDTSNDRVKGIERKYYGKYYATSSSLPTVTAAAAAAAPLIDRIPTVLIPNDLKCRQYIIYNIFYKYVRKTNKTHMGNLKEQTTTESLSSCAIPSKRQRKFYYYDTHVYIYIHMI